MTSWKEYSLADVAEVTTGFPFKGSKYADSGTRVLRGENVTIGSLRWDTVKCWNEDFEQAKKYALRDGDIVIGMDGSRVGKNRAQIRKSDLPLLLAQRVACVRAKEGYSQDLLAYLVKSPKFEQYVSSVQTGTSIPHISQKQIEEYKIILTDDLPTQNAIAEILISLDNKIEHNNQINRNLEALAEIIFKQWFIDFEFPNESGLPYKSNGGEMIESELGEIPVNWRIRYLNEFTECFDNKRIPLSSLEREKRQGVYPYYGASGVIDRVDGYLFDGTYVLLSEDGENLRTRNTPIAFEADGRFWVNNHAHILQGSLVTTELLLCFLQTVSVSHLITGAVQPKLNQANMNMITLALPNDLALITNVQNSITELVRMVRENRKANDSLQVLRDALLPKLISGKLTIK